MGDNTRLNVVSTKTNSLRGVLPKFLWTKPGHQYPWSSRLTRLLSLDFGAADYKREDPMY